MTGGGRALLAAAGLASVLLAGRAVRPRTGSSWTRTNFRGRAVSLSLGVVAVVALLVGCALAATAGDDDVRRTAVAMACLAAGAGGVGLYDDQRGNPATKGLAGHLRALVHGNMTTGALKVVAIAVSAFGAALVLSRGRIDLQVVVDAAVVAGAANLANLFDLRPGRALKVILLAAVPIVVAGPAAVGGALAWPAGVAAGLLPADLRERGMLGDGGANALGGVVGVAVASAGGLAWSLVALAVVVAGTLLSEVVSYSRVIESVPVLRWADQLGRAA